MWRRTESYSPCRDFVEEKLGSKYVIGRALDFAASFEESGPATPMCFILSPGVDPLKDVEKHGNALCCFMFNKPSNSASECSELLSQHTYCQCICAGFSWNSLLKSKEGMAACMSYTVRPTAVEPHSAVSLLWYQPSLPMHNGLWVDWRNYTKGH